MRKDSMWRPRARAGATRAMAIALLVVVALAGMGLGFAADRLAFHHERGSGRRGMRDAGRGMRDGRHGGDGMRERLARELDLTPDQQRRVESIMKRQEPRLPPLSGGVQP